MSSFPCESEAGHKISDACGHHTFKASWIPRQRYAVALALTRLNGDSMVAIAYKAPANLASFHYGDENNLVSR